MSDPMYEVSMIMASTKTINNIVEGYEVQLKNPRNLSPQSLSSIEEKLVICKRILGERLLTKLITDGNT